MDWNCLYDIPNGRWLPRCLVRLLRFRSLVSSFSERHHPQKCLVLMHDLNNHRNLYFGIHVPDLNRKNYKAIRRPCNYDSYCCFKLDYRDSHWYRSCKRRLLFSIPPKLCYRLGHYIDADLRWQDCLHLMDMDLPRFPMGRCFGSSSTLRNHFQTRHYRSWISRRKRKRWRPTWSTMKNLKWNANWIK